MEFFATCGRGLEKALGTELRRAGVHRVRPLGGGVSFEGEVEDAYRALLWSRVASRVLVSLARVNARNADTLYEGVKAIPWEEHLPQGGTIAVDARGTNDSLRDTRFTALKAKDAVCDRLRDLWGERPDVDTHNPFLRINVLVSRDKATISIDLSGHTLEQRGYRSAGKPAGAPLRENLAASILYLAEYDELSKEGAALVNPYCGTGALAIEAAMMAADIAPGISRSSWGFQRWLLHDQDVWDRLIDEADARAEEGVENAPAILASDSDSAALEYAKACAKRAGVAGLITFVEPGEELAALEEAGAEKALLTCNLSGNEQFSSLAQLPPLYATIATQVRQSEAIQKLAVLTVDPAIDGSMGMHPVQSLELRNGANMACLKMYDTSNISVSDQVTVEVAGQELFVNDENVQQFVARLSKMAKQRRKWAKKNGVNAYRIYDADLPDYNLAVDLYCGAAQDTGRTLVHVSEYAAPKQIDPDKVARRLSDALTVIPAVLGISPADLYVKRRLRAKGGSQYADSAALGDVSGSTLITQENGLLFEVNLGDRLDTGLFLDHRDTRKLLSQLAKGRSFLNLFAYTGSASVYAAAGGAKFTTTVDLSNTYQEWSRRNMELNGFKGRDYQFERADVLAWVQEKRHSRERWDLIFVDPPTFSNSAKMGKNSWDVQADHAELLIGVSRLLTRQGAIMFSCNLRSFKPDAEKLAKAGVVMVDITDKTIPEDFARHNKVHHCYLLRRG